MKTFKRITSFFLALLLAFTTLALVSTSAQAYTISASGGGSGITPGGRGGASGGGIWSQQFQGLRITIVDKNGKPAMTYGTNRASLDLVYSYTNINTKVDYFCKGVKTDPSSWGAHRRNSGDTSVLEDLEFGSYVVSRGTFVNAVTTGGWGFAAPAGNKDLDASTLNSMPLPFTQGSTSTQWILHGEEIRGYIFGNNTDVANGKPSDKAMLYVLFNMVNPGRRYTWNLIDTSGLTAEEIKQYGLGVTVDKEDRFTPIDAMVKCGYSIVVEPLLWAQLRSGENGWGPTVYGTPTGIGLLIPELVKNGELGSAGADNGGWDRNMFRASRTALYLDKNVPWASGNPIAQFSIPDKAVKISKGVDLWISNSEVGRIDPGIGVHIYVCKSGDTSTSTYDEPQGDTPAPAPDPSKIPNISTADPKLLTVNIVKTYRDKKLEDNSYEHKGTFVRQKNPSKIVIEDEQSYKVKEWFISTGYNNPSTTTEWEENKMMPVGTGDKVSGSGTGQVEVKSPNVTLYVLLEKEIDAPPPPPTPDVSDLDITESRVTRAIETMDGSVPGWGVQTMHFNANDISGTCPYIWYCGGCCGNEEDGYYCPGHVCGNPYYLDDTSWSYNHHNVGEIKSDIQATKDNNFVALNVRGDDATGDRGTVYDYSHGISSFNYKLVIWRGNDIPTIASYKEPSSVVLNSLLGRYGKEPKGQRHASNGSSWASVVTWQPYLEDEILNKVSI